MRLIDADAIPYTMLYKENFMTGTGMEKQAVWKDDIDRMPIIIYDYGVTGEPGPIGPKETNADSLRTMTDEELAKFMAIQQNIILELCEKELEKIFGVLPETGDVERVEAIAIEWLDWLKQEAKE